MIRVNHMILSGSLTDMKYSVDSSVLDTDSNYLYYTSASMVKTIYILGDYDKTDNTFKSYRRIQMLNLFTITVSDKCIQQFIQLGLGGLLYKLDSDEELKHIMMELL